jgi:hypothetical protein
MEKCPAGCIHWKPPFCITDAFPQILGKGKESPSIRILAFEFKNRGKRCIDMHCNPVVANPTNTFKFFVKLGYSLLSAKSNYPLSHFLLSKEKMNQKRNDSFSNEK